MGEPMGRGLKQLMGAGGVEALAESNRLQGARKLKERYWSLKRSIESKEKELEAFREKNSVKLLLGQDLETSDEEHLKGEIHGEREELGSIVERLEEMDVFMDHPKSLETPSTEENDDRRDLFDMEFDTNTLFDKDDRDLPEFEEILEDIRDIPNAEDITLPKASHTEEEPEGGPDAIARYRPPASSDPSYPPVPEAEEIIQVKRAVRVRRKKVITSMIDDIIMEANDLNIKGSTGKAIELLESKLSFNDDHEEMLYLLGNLNFKRGDLEKAERYYRWAVKKNGNSFRSLNNLGILLQNDGRLEEAVLSFNQALEINSKYERAWFNLGSIFMEIRPPMYEEASIFMKRALECDPQYSKAQEKLDICNNMLN